MEKSTKLLNQLSKNLPWSNANHPIWPVTSILVRRNLNHFLFPNKLSKKVANEVLQKIEKAFPKGKTFTTNTLSTSQKELIFERFFLSEQYEKQDSEGGFSLDESTLFLATINLEDHLHLHKLCFDQNFQTSWNFVLGIEKSLTETLNFSYSERFGYLTANPEVCGTGLVVQAFIHLPAHLQLNLLSLIKKKVPDGILIKGLLQDHHFLGDFLIIENKYTLGVTEEFILNSVYQFAKTLADQENELRNTLSIEHQTILKDKVGRSYGVLSNAGSLELQEALNHLSLLHLGKELKWLKNAEKFHFFDLFFSLRRTHLFQEDRSNSHLETPLSTKRASCVRKEISLIDASHLFKELN